MLYSPEETVADHELIGKIFLEHLEEHAYTYGDSASAKTCFEEIAHEHRLPPELKSEFHAAATALDKNIPLDTNNIAGRMAELFTSVDTPAKMEFFREAMIKNGAFLVKTNLAGEPFVPLRAAIENSAIDLERHNYEPILKELGAMVKAQDAADPSLAAPKAVLEPILSPHAPVMEPIITTPAASVGRFRAEAFYMPGTKKASTAPTAVGAEQATPLPTTEKSPAPEKVSETVNATPDPSHLERAAEPEPVVHSTPAPADKAAEEHVSLPEPEKLSPPPAAPARTGTALAVTAPATEEVEDATKASSKAPFLRKLLFKSEGGIHLGKAAGLAAVGATVLTTYELRHKESQQAAKENGGGRGAGV